MVQHLIDDLNLKKDVVFMGHSRGSENALKMGALNEVSIALYCYCSMFRTNLLESS